jgi:hypothetical protein
MSQAPSQPRLPAMGDIWSAVIALSTLALAVATFWLGWQARRQVVAFREGRVADLAEQRRSAMRAAIAEAVENCRRCLSHEPRTETADSRQVIGIPPDFAALTALLGSMDLPPDLVAYLIWARGHAQALSGRYGRLVDETWGGVRNSATAFNQLRGVWNEQLDILQSIACLLRAHAGGDPTLEPSSTGFEFRQWLTAREGPPNARLQTYAMILRPHYGAPEFPSSKSEYAVCAPEARDAEGASVGEATRAAMARPGQEMLDRLRHPSGL